MYRKVSIPGRRSSQLKRLSAVPNDVPQEKSGKGCNDGKKSFIPRPAVFVSRSSSADRDVGVASTSRYRSSSVESILDQGQRSLVRPRSIENVTTPKNLTKTPVVASRTSRATSTCKKSVRRDTRPLTDRGYQCSQLSKVHEYLLKEGILEPHQIQEVRSTMTLKMFVHVINSLFQRLFPSLIVTVGNYCELVPIIMKKLRYPGAINRSWLVTANSPHSWPHVLGIMSWLTNVLYIPPLEFICDDDDLEIDKVIKMLSYTGKRYAEWTEYEVDVETEIDQQFYDELVQDKCEALSEQILAVEKEIENLMSLESEIDGPEEKAAQQKFERCLKEQLRKEAEVNNLSECLKNLMLNLEKGEEEKKMLLNRIESQKIQIDMKRKSCKKDASSEQSQVTDEDNAKLQSEVVSLENVVRLQKKHVADISQQWYNDDLAIARMQASFEKKVLHRNAILRECTCESLDINKFQINLSHLDREYDSGMKRYLDNVQEVTNNLQEVINDNENKRKETSIKINELTESIKRLEENYSTKTVEEASLNKELERKKKIKSNLDSKVNENLQEQTRKNLNLTEVLDKAKLELMNLESEHKSLEEKLQKDKEKYVGIIGQCNKEIQDQIKKCTEILKGTFE